MDNKIKIIFVVILLTFGIGYMIFTSEDARVDSKRKNEEYKKISTTLRDNNSTLKNNSIISNIASTYK